MPYWSTAFIVLVQLNYAVAPLAVLLIPGQNLPEVLP
jgi:hypothetical protein